MSLKNVVSTLDVWHCERSCMTIPDPPENACLIRTRVKFTMHSIGRRNPMLWWLKQQLIIGFQSVSHSDPYSTWTEMLTITAPNMWPCTIQWLSCNYCSVFSCPALVIRQPLQALLRRLQHLCDVCAQHWSLRRQQC